MNRTINTAAAEAVAQALFVSVNEGGWDAATETVRDAYVQWARNVLAAEQCGAWGGCSLPHGHNLSRADIPMNHRVPSATREDVETITIPRPHVPHGPATVAWDVADADYLRRAARDLEEVYKPFGSNLRATIVALIRDAADAITPRTDR